MSSQRTLQICESVIFYSRLSALLLVKGKLNHINKLNNKQKLEIYQEY